MIWTQYEPHPWVFSYFTLTVSTLDSFIASRHWHRSNPGSFFEQFFNSRTKGNERNFPKKVNLRWSFEQLPCIRLSRPGFVDFLDPAVKISLSGAFHSFQYFLCSWSGCQVNLEKLKVSKRWGVGGLPFALPSSQGFAVRACWRMLWCSRKSSCFDFFFIRVLSLARMELTWKYLMILNCSLCPPVWWH